MLSICILVHFCSIIAGISNNHRTTAHDRGITRYAFAQAFVIGFPKGKSAVRLHQKISKKTWATAYTFGLVHTASAPQFSMRRLSGSAWAGFCVGLSNTCIHYIWSFTGLTPEQPKVKGSQLPIKHFRNHTSALAQSDPQISKNNFLKTVLRKHLVKKKFLWQKQYYLSLKIRQFCQLSKDQGIEPMMRQQQRSWSIGHDQ